MTTTDEPLKRTLFYWSLVQFNEESNSLISVFISCHNATWYVQYVGHQNVVVTSVCVCVCVDSFLCKVIFEVILWQSVPLLVKMFH